MTNDVLEGITAEELRSRAKSWSTTPDDERTRCPECYTVDPQPTGNGFNTEVSHDYYCDNCRLRFDEDEAYVGPVDTDANTSTEEFE